MYEIALFFILHGCIHSRQPLCSKDHAAPGITRKKCLYSNQTEVLFFKCAKSQRLNAKGPGLGLFSLVVNRQGPPEAMPFLSSMV